MYTYTHIIILYIIIYYYVYVYIYMKYDTKIGIDHRSKGPVHLWLRVDDLDPGRLDPWLFSSGTLKRSGTGPNR